MYLDRERFNHKGWEIPWAGPCGDSVDKFDLDGAGAAPSTADATSPLVATGLSVGFRPMLDAERDGLSTGSFICCEIQDSACETPPPSTSPTELAVSLTLSLAIRQKPSFYRHTQTAYNLNRQPASSIQLQYSRFCLLPARHPLPIDFCRQPRELMRSRQSSSSDRRLCLES